MEFIYTKQYTLVRIFLLVCLRFFFSLKILPSFFIIMFCSLFVRYLVTSDFGIFRFLFCFGSSFGKCFVSFFLIIYMHLQMDEF